MLRDLQIASTYDLQALFGSWSDWMPLDRPSEAAVEAQGGAPKSGVVESPRSFDPLNVKALMTETQDGIKLLKTLGEMLSGSKDDITKAVTDALPSQEKKAAAEVSRLDERNAYLSAIADVAIRETELQTKTDPLEKAKAQAELLKAKLAANKAALKAGLALPFGELYSPPTR